MERKLDDSLQITPSCTSPCLKFDEDTVNTWWCRLTEDGRLVNQNSPQNGHVAHSPTENAPVITYGRDTHLSPKYLNSYQSFPTGTGSSPYSLNPYRSLTPTLPAGNLRGRQSPIVFGRQSPLPDVFRYDLDLSLNDSLTSDYVSPLVSSRQRPQRLKIYPGVLGTSCLRGLGQRYWQVEVTCDVILHLYGLPIFEAGVAWGQGVDTSGLVEGEGQSWILRLTTCDDHPDHVCAKALHGCRPLSHSTVRECKKNEKFVVKYGFLLNFDRKELVLIDINKKEVLHVIDNLDTSRDLWPVFGVFSRHRHHVEMKVLAGKDLRMDMAVSSIISKMVNPQTDGHAPRIAGHPVNMRHSMFRHAT